MKILYLANVRMPTEKAHRLQSIKTYDAIDEVRVDKTLVLLSRPGNAQDVAENFRKSK